MKFLSLFKHVLLVVGAVVLLVFAGIVVWPNRQALTVFHLSFAAGCIVLAFGLAVPADFKNACQTIAPYIPMIRGSAPPSSAE